MHLKKKNRDGLTYLEWCLKAGIGDMDVASFMAVRETCELAWDEGANPQVVQLILFVKEGVDFPRENVSFESSPIQVTQQKILEIRKAYPTMSAKLCASMMDFSETYIRKLAEQAGVPWE